MNSSLKIRLATPEDAPRLAELNRAAYPDLVEDGVVFDEAQLLGHTTVFPRGLGSPGPVVLVHRLGYPDFSPVCT